MVDSYSHFDRPAQKIGHDAVKPVRRFIQNSPPSLHALHTSGVFLRRSKKWRF